MAVIQPGDNDALLSWVHGLMHRAIAIDDSAQAQTIIAQAAGDVDLAVSELRITALGGVAVKFTNNTGAQIDKGYVVSLSTTADDEIVLTAVGNPDPMGIAYENIADGDPGWVVVSGKAEIYVAGNATRGQFVRMTVLTDTGDGPGIAIVEPFPSSPFATDKHFLEVGHCSQSRVGAGLCRCVLQFN